MQDSQNEKEDDGKKEHRRRSRRGGDRHLICIFRQNDAVDHLTGPKEASPHLTSCAPFSRAYAELGGVPSISHEFHELTRRREDKFVKCVAKSARLSTLPRLVVRSFQPLDMTMKTATNTPAANARILYFLFSLSTAGSRWEAPT